MNLTERLKYIGNTSYHGEIDEKSLNEESLWNTDNYLKATKRSLSDIRYDWNTKLRTLLALWSATIVTIWLFKVINIVKLNDANYHLSDAVLIALLTTTTFNILGLTYIVLKGLFKSDENI